ncbi:MAG: hypothetical protein HONBIEJF_01069 [Fimbriimonadaceae bacterium]|nr:hypothetical protein [Fimbriimonadaceae bacterium]
MANPKKLSLPPKDPFGTGDIVITEITGETSGVVVRGHFEVPKWARLEPEQASFLETFLRCRGVIASMEKELGLSYPTVRARLDSLLAALNLEPVKEEKQKRVAQSTNHQDVLDRLARGEIDAAEAKRLMRGEAAVN